EMYVSSQFSQRQELKADEYGFKVTTEHGRSPYAMFNSLVKLTQLGPGSHLSVIEQAFSSHPDSELRAARMKEKADAYVNKPAQ
ncbi:MAG: M48 family metalloprotease, partial [Bacteroidales bacterium]|nr:M48 family metalloprotease [Bacteroidales bacterium]